MFVKAVTLFAALAAVQALRPLVYGVPLFAAAPYGGVSVQKTAINHVAPAAPLAYATPLAYAAPFAYAAHLAYAAPLAYRRGLGAGHHGHGLGALLAYEHGLAASLRTYGHGVLGDRYGGVLGLGMDKAVL